MNSALRSLLLAAVLLPAAAMSQIREEYLPLVELLSTSPEREPSEGNLVQFFECGPEVFSLMQEDIMAAKKTIHSEFFLFDQDEAGFLFRTGFRLKALEGVEVRYISEDFTQKASFINPMRKSGVDVKHHPFFPLRPRNHQKFLLIDCSVGYCGGANITMGNFFEWDDMSVRVQGPVVAKMEMAYAKMWKKRKGKESAWEIRAAEPYEGGVIVQSVAEFPKEKSRLNLNAYIWALDHAREYFYAKSPYLKPPEELIEAMINAARRGVDVRLLLPALKDPPTGVIVPFERVFYEDLMKAGVHIHIRTDKFDHGKMFVSDGYLSAVGSVNLDVLSLVSNYENNLFFYDEGIASELRRFIEEDMSNDNELTPEQVEAFPRWQSAFKGTFRVLGHLF